MSYNAIFIRRANKILVPHTLAPSDDVPGNFSLVASFDANLRKLGYTLDGALAIALLEQPKENVIAVAESTVAAVKELKGVRNYRPMYPNFPTQVMEASAAELYLNAILHYFTTYGLGLPGWLPEYPEHKRPALSFDESKFTVLKGGTDIDFHKLMTKVVLQKAAYSEQDRADILELSDTTIMLNSFNEFDNRENKAWIAAQTFKRAKHIGDITFDTATDVLRFAVALNDGDVSLAEGTKFKSFKRSERRMLNDFLLQIIDRKGLPAVTEDMVRHSGAWKRLGERVHPGEHNGQVAAAYAAVRNGTAKSFNAYVEKHLADDNIGMLKSLLIERPGDFVRRLDAVLVRAKSHDKANEVLDALAAVAHEASATVLLQAQQAFATRNRDIRAFIPKGQIAHLKAVKEKRKPLPAYSEARAVDILTSALVKKFSSLEPLGKVYLDPELKNVVVPFGMRSSSKQLATLGRGSRLSLDKNANILRFFIWWKNDDRQTDIDLSAVALDGEFNSMFDVAYYNLREKGGVHSGDITNAPNGASEFIDIDIDKMLEQGVRYVAMNVISFSGQNMSELPECFAGFMSRQDLKSGEVYDPRTVSNRADLTAGSRSAVPYIFDLRERQAIWADLSVNVRRLGANVANSKGSLVSLMEAVVKMQPPTLHELFRLHRVARGEVANTPEEADVIFTVDRSDDERVTSAYQTEEILSQYL